MRVCNWFGIAVAVWMAGCGGAPSAPSATTALTGRVADSAGDTIVRSVLRGGVSITPVVPVPSDLTGAILEVSAGNLTATLTFAPGTLSRTDTFACVMLDVDEDAQTGTRLPADPALGYDYSVCAVLPRGSVVAQLSRLGSATAVGVGTGTVTFPAADELRMAVPLALLGNDDERFSFRVTAAQWVDLPILNSDVLDWMPDLGQPAGVVR